MMDDAVIEQGDSLPAPMMDMHRAIASLTQELGALDRYSQRFEACTDPELKRVLAHHRDANLERVAMLLEWMRRRDPRLDHELRRTLFKAGPITAPNHHEINTTRNQDD